MRLGKLLFKSFVRFTYGILASHPIPAKIFLNLLGKCLKQIPDSNILKRYAVSSLSLVQWPELTFLPQEVFITRQTKVKLTPNIGEFNFNALFFKHLPYEAEIFKELEARIKDYDAIVEIGANIGVYTIFFDKFLKQINKQIPVFAFEPSSQAYFRLQQNLFANNARNVFTFNCAVNDQTIFTQFFEPVGHLTNGSLHRDFATIFAKEVQSNHVLAINGHLLLQLLSGYKKILLKIDVEGSEEAVIHSLTSLIEDKKPEIILEILPYTAEALNGFDHLFKQYRLYHITTDGLIPKEKFASHPHFRDYLLVPI